VKKKIIENTFFSSVLSNRSEQHMLFFPLLVIVVLLSCNAISIEKEKERKKCMFPIGACLFRIFLDLTTNVQLYRNAKEELNDYLLYEISNEFSCYHQSRRREKKRTKNKKKKTEMEDRYSSILLGDISFTTIEQKHKR
jgi:hypothetical protein